MWVPYPEYLALTLTQREAIVAEHNRRAKKS